MIVAGYTSGDSINNRPVEAVTRDSLLARFGLNANNQQDVPTDLGAVAATRVQ